MDLGITATGLLTGVLVGLTGMGGGALTMPLLTLVFGVPPLAAVSTDLVTSAVMKPVGAAVHLRRRTADPGLVGWLCLGSLPCAALGSLLAGSLGSAESVLKVLTGLAVLLAAVLLFVRMYLARGAEPVPVVVRPLPTVLLGGVAGLVVGTTSVGSGSIIIVCLLLLNRGLSSARLVGTDLVQAVPLVLVAAVGHLYAGDVHFGLAGELLAGAVPGVLAGALVSSRVPDRPVRVLLGGMLVTTGAMLLELSAGLAAGLGTLVVLGAFAAPRLFARGVTAARSAKRVDVGEEGGTG